MTTLWITGAGGVVGSKLLTRAAASGRFDRIAAFAHALPTSPPPGPGVAWAALDIGDRAAVQAAATQVPPELVINPAALTNVDACETRRADARRANTDGPRWLAEICRERAAPLLHVSTDYVFPGDAAHPGPYAEDAPPRAISWYGQTKLDGEQAIRDVLGDTGPWTIVRTALVYGFIPGGRANFVTWLAKELRAGRRVRIVRDQFNTPTLADDLAALLLWLAVNPRQGVYHGAGPDLVGRHEWALAIAAQFGLDTTLIDWVTTPELAQPAARPLRSGLLTPRWDADRALGAPDARGVLAGLAAFDWLAG